MPRFESPPNMQTINTNEIRKGMVIEYEGALQDVVDAQLFKPGKGAMFVRARLRNLRTGSLVDYKIVGAASIQRAFLDERDLQYLYREGDVFHLMDAKTFEQYAVDKPLLGDAVMYLKENMVMAGRFHDDTLLSVELPPSVVLKIVETPPSVRGDTVSGGTKPATLESGAVVQVPLFVEVGTLIRVDTRDNRYLERA